MAKEDKTDDLNFAGKWSEDWCLFVPMLCGMKEDGASGDTLSARSFRVGHQMGQRRGRGQVFQEIRSGSAN